MSIGDLYNWAECTLSEFADDTKEGEVAATSEDHAATQRVLDKLEKWADRNLVNFNKQKCKVLHLRRNNPKHKYVSGTATRKAALTKRTCVS